VKFCLPSIARILKVREFIQVNSSTDFEQSISPTIDSNNFSIAKKCFSGYPDLQFETKFLSDYNLKFTNEFSTNYQKMVVANIILSKYGRAKTKFFAQNTEETKNVTDASLVFYNKVLTEVKKNSK